MKKIIVVATAAALALALGGCASQPASSSASSESSAPAASDVSASASSASAQAESTVKWVEVDSADQAAEGAGFAKFGVMDKIRVGDHVYENPTFAYAEGVAQATYEHGAIALIVRKADGSHTAPLTDRDKTEFAQKWTKSYEGLDVTLYGAAEGAATVFEWNDGTQDFCVTYQGLGGEEVSMDSDDVQAIVKGFKEANATEEKKTEETEKSSEASEPEGNGVDNNLTEADVENIIWENGLGEFDGAFLIQANDGIWYWQATCKDVNAKEHTYMIDPDGNVSEVTGDPSVEGQGDEGEAANEGVDNNLTEADVENIIWENGLGEFDGAFLIQANDNVWYWQATCKDADGNEHTYMIDPDGNVSEVTGDPSVEGQGDDNKAANEGVDNNLTEADVENIIWENGLGEFDGAFLIQANDNVWYWQATCKDADGNEHTYMIDPDGNVSEV